MILVIWEGKKSYLILHFDMYWVNYFSRWEPFYKSALGTFFLNLGLNHVQEFIQSDVVKMQKRKMEKMKGTPTPTDKVMRIIFLF